MKYIDPDGRALNFIIGAAVGFVANKLLDSTKTDVKDVDNPGASLYVKAKIKEAEE